MNRVQAMMSAGEVAFGTFVTLKDPAIIEMIGWAGYDFIVIDTEHAVTDLGTAAALVRAAELSGVTAFARIPYRDMSAALRLVEHGVKGILAPHVTSPRHAEELANTIKYRPDGDRGIDPATRSARYGLDEFVAHARQVNEDVMALGLIEDEAGVDALDSIIETGVVDGAMLGASDLARSYGVQGQPDHPLVVQAMNRSSDLLAKHGIPVMRAAYDGAAAAKAISSGTQLITAPAVDAYFVAHALRDHLRAVKHAAGLPDGTVLPQNAAGTP